MAVGIAILLRKVSNLPKLTQKDACSPVLPVVIGWMGVIISSVARAFPLPTEVGWGHWPYRFCTAGGWSEYTLDQSFPVHVYVSVGSGESNGVGKQSSLDRSCDEHLQPHDRVGTGGAMGPVKVARGGRGS